MENLSRSKSTREGRYQMESYNYGATAENPNPVGMQDLRSYSYSTSRVEPTAYSYTEKDIKFNSKNKNRASSISKSWSFTADPELQRKKRVASYKVYAMEGKMKGSLRKSFRWIKDHVFHGW